MAEFWDSPTWPWVTVDGIYVGDSKKPSGFEQVARNGIPLWRRVNFVCFKESLQEIPFKLDQNPGNRPGSWPISGRMSWRFHGPAQSLQRHGARARRSLRRRRRRVTEWPSGWRARGRRCQTGSMV